MFITYALARRITCQAKSTSYFRTSGTQWTWLAVGLESLDASNFSNCQMCFDEVETCVASLLTVLKLSRAFLYSHCLKRTSPSDLKFSKDPAGPPSELLSYMLAKFCLDDQWQMSVASEPIWRVAWQRLNSGCVTKFLTSRPPIKGLWSQDGSVRSWIIYFLNYLLIAITGKIWQHFSRWQPPAAVSNFTAEWLALQASNRVV